MAGIAAIDLFAGAGGMSEGARLAGVEVALAVEIDPHAAETYGRNHGTTEVFNRDIRRLGKRQLNSVKTNGRATVLFGGPPCRGFSYSNLRTRSSANSDNWLFLEFFRIARIWQPDFVVFENVRGIINTEEGVFIDRIMSEFADIGYTAA